jgi:hypothetical protein
VFAISDLHSSHAANRLIIDDLRPECEDDWLIVAGDVGETFGARTRIGRLGVMPGSRNPNAGCLPSAQT